MALFGVAGCARGLPGCAGQGKFYLRQDAEQYAGKGDLKAAEIGVAQRHPRGAARSGAAGTARRNLSRDLARLSVSFADKPDAEKLLKDLPHS